MPCTSYGYEYETSSRAREIDALEATVERRNAMLCAIFSVAATLPNGVKGMLDTIDYKEAGIRRYEMEKWWEEHQIEDARRREAEKAEKERKAAEKARKEARKNLIATLTPEQVALLGVK